MMGEIRGFRTPEHGRTPHNLNPRVGYIAEREWALELLC